MRINEAPGDYVLFDMLKKAHEEAETLPHWFWDFGFTLDLLPDPEYMINMIFMFNWNHPLKGSMIPFLNYYPV